MRSSPDVLALPFGPPGIHRLVKLRSLRKAVRRKVVAGYDVIKPATRNKVIENVPRTKRSGFMRFPPGISIALVALRAFLAVPIASSRQEPQITAQQMCDFLRHAEVVRSKTARKGVTGVAPCTEGA